MSVKVAASVLSADLSRLAEHLSLVKQAGADMVHVDIMDGHFVPSLSFGPMMVAAVTRSTDLPARAHLMVSDPSWLIRECVDAGASSVTVHVESTPHIHRLLARIKELGVGVGVALNPGTPLCAIEWVLPMVDSVTVMTVDPGFAGQKFIPEVLPKISALREMAQKLNAGVDIVVDGGINANTAAASVQAGATILVAGSYVFGSSDMKAAINSLKKAGLKA